MAYDRYDRSRGMRDEDLNWNRDRGDYDRGRRDERGFFERAGDQISSWFGDDDSHHSGGSGRPDRAERQGVWDRDAERGYRERTFQRGQERDEYRPMTGDYARRESSQFFAASGRGAGEDYRGSERSARRGQDFDPHYHSWRERQISELDRDYDEYRRENQSRFEREFSSWREQRQAKRALLGRIREHMEVVGNDDVHVGTVDRIAGDRIVLAKSDPDSGGAHHSLSCADIASVDGDRVVLDCAGEQAKERWRDENRSRALFEREDQGEMGPRMLDRSFEGTYR